MAKSRDNYIITGRSVDEVVRELNFFLQRMADRMDKIEGIRGTSSIESNLDMNSNRIVEVAAALNDDEAVNKSQADLTGNSPTFNSVTSDTDVSVGGNVFVYDSDDELIHSME